VEAFWRFCPSCAEPLAPLRRGPSGLVSALTLLAALLTLAVANTVWLAAVPLAVGGRPDPFLLLAWALLNFSLAGAFFVFFKSLRTSGAGRRPDPRHTRPRREDAPCHLP
jgi:hypothetical protein